MPPATDGQTAPIAASPMAVGPLSAVRVLYSTDRNAAEYDILVATAVECLRTSDETLEDLSRKIQEVWPGARVVQLSIVAALAAAEAAGLIGRSNGRFTLTASGRREIEKSRSWAEDAYQRIAIDIRARATDALYPISDEQSQLWVGLLSHALLSGIATATAAYRGEVDLRGPGLVSPRAIDFEAVEKTLERAKIGADVQDFLVAASVAAVDPSDPFGNELVSTITTGYLLQAFVARRDAIRTRQGLGEIRGQTCIIDTPVLFQLLAPPSRPAAIDDVVTAALVEGVDIVVCEHNLEELFQVLRRVERQHSVAIAGATQNARTVEQFRRFVDEELIEIYLSGFEAGDFKTWAGYRAHVEGIRERLTSRGVRIIAHGNSAEDQADQLFSALASLLAERGRDRGVEETRRDAETMAVAWRIRRLANRDEGLWPAAWVVTPDTHMSVAYGRVNREDGRSLTVSPSQWVSILSAFAAPAALEELAQSGAAMLAQETMLRVAARFPAAAVVAIVEALSAQTSDTDVRLAQLELDDLLRDFPAKAANPQELGIAAASAMLERRARRLDIAQEEHAKRVARDQAIVAREREASDLIATQERHLREKTEATLRDREARVKSLEADVITAGVLGRRATIRLAVTLTAVIVAALGLLASVLTEGFDATLVVLAITAVISAGLFFFLSSQWTKDVASDWRSLLVSLVPQTVTVLAIVRDLTD